VSANRLRQAAFRLAVAAAGILCFALPAQAEKADRTKPIHLEADRVTVDDAKQIATFIGNVVFTQGTLVMRGDRAEVRQDKEGFKQGVMWGNLAYFRQKREGYDEYIEGWAERVEYDGRADKVQMFNRAMLKRGQDEARGSYISYDSNTEFFQVQGGGPKSAAARSGDERVRVILQPKPKDAKPPAQPGPAKGDEATQETRGDAGGSR
jgi:lipopolysaccharide export system protein LptA